ncbi:hypothetical protein [Larkinella terrae]|uniref:Uncharacterized protein n=1 Tax=Larkinella terrae TaxID=2025311 RepID=A0A7K0ER90_9BACT|nr:hypothetical protein [Larkinella terrae]MRS64335.1 hypothetical protein [Larkinella terrae]
MLYIITLLVTLLIVVCCIVIDSISYYLRLKNELVDALMKVCINQDADLKLQTILIGQQGALSDEQLLHQLTDWLKSNGGYRPMETQNLLEKQYAKRWMMNEVF